MNAMPHTRGGVRRAGRGPAQRRRALAKAGALLACAALLTGCASMPDGSDVTKVGDETRTDSDPQVRVFGVQPQKNEQPMQIVSGFLEAVTSDEADYQTARKYLTGPAAHWDPFSQITVVSGGPRLTVQHNDADRLENGTTIALTADQVAVVDRKHSYTPVSATYRTSFHLTQVGGEWRIDALPDGLVLGDSDFQRIYHSVNMYYYAQLGTNPEGPAKDVLVADPVYVRRRIDPVTSSVQALLSGPSTWLQPVVDSAFPAGTTLKGQNLALDDSGRLRVPLSSTAEHASRPSCERMAAQLLFTVQDQSTGQVTSVDVERADGSSLCSMSRDRAQAYAPARVTGSGSQQYFVDDDHRLESVDPDGGTPQPVAGPFGKGQAGLGSVAVSRDEQTAAGVSTDGRTLSVAPLNASGTPKQVATSAAHSADEGFTAPSWDGLGDLWVADRDPGDPRLLMWQDGRTTEVTVPDLSNGTIEAVKVAADGVRIALLVNRDGHTTLQLGRVERSGTATAPQVSVTELRDIAPQLEDVQAASWAGESRLVVVGKQSHGVQQLQYVDTDGSAAYTPTLPGISKVSAVAAFEDQTRPLLVASDEGMFRLPEDGEWKLVSQDGTSPVYPG
ncbi:LpqB family beta-propeller domain-containing protein [Streptantibioticus parmotrematis]|uniref:LpqB family beta-propeller domain-containing protein n=1 Tax=Streptantibioticus parmotrematis TaxID=2873249 RepID=UPI0033C23095